MSGVPGSSLSDDQLRHELTRLKQVQSDIHESGTPHQRTNHAARTAELEAEFLRRFPADEP